MSYDTIFPYFSHFPSKIFQRNMYIYQEGETPEYIYFIKSGVVGLFHNSENGKETFLRVFGAHSIFGHRSYFANQSYHANTVVLAKSDVIAVPIKDFEDISIRNPIILKKLIEIIAIDLANAEVKYSQFQDKSANLRIAESLVFLKLKYPEMTWTRKEVGEFSASTLESVTRLMTKLEDEKIIKKVGRDFEILKLNSLLKLPEHLR